MAIAEFGTQPIQANWINLSNSAQIVFHANDQVIFNDLAGAPTTVTISGTVSPSLITVDSRTNNYTFSDSGSISGPVSLVKEGTSLLTIENPANITGPVFIGGRRDLCRQQLLRFGLFNYGHQFLHLGSGGRQPP